MVSFNGRKVVRLDLGRDRRSHKLDLDAGWFRPGVNELQLSGKPGAVALARVELQLPGPVAWITADDTTRRALVSGSPLVVDLPHPLPAGALLDVSLAAVPRLLPLAGRDARFDAWLDHIGI